jgi:hypothetical protein
MNDDYDEFVKKTPCLQGVLERPFESLLAAEYDLLNSDWCQLAFLISGEQFPLAFLKGVASPPLK